MKMEGIELYPHNQKAYDNLCAMLRDSKPIYEPKDFHVIDEIKDPRELAEELREALNPSTTIDEKISFLEEIAAQNGGQL